MNESQSLGMQGLAGTNVEAVVYELLVFAGRNSLQYFMSAISLIVEEHMSYMFHVYSYLVCPPCFENALDECDIADSFQNLIVCYGVFPDGWIAEYSHLHPVFRVPGNVTLYPSFVFLNDAPYQCIVFTLGGFVEELDSQTGLCIGSLGHDQ